MPSRIAVYHIWNPRKERREKRKSKEPEKGKQEKTAVEHPLNDSHNLRIRQRKEKKKRKYG